MKRAKRIPLAKPRLKRLARSLTAEPRWRPLTLTWRRLSRVSTSRIPKGRAIVRNGLWPRFSLHLKLAFTALAQTNVFRIATGTEPAILWRRSLAHLTSMQRIVQLSLTTRRLLLDRTLRDVAVHKRSIRTSTQTEVRTFVQTQKLPLRAARAGSRVRQSRPDARRTSSLFFVDTIAVRRSHDLFLTRHRVAHSTTVSRAELVLASGAVKPLDIISRPPELVWRSEPQPFALDAIERSISAATSSVASFSGASAPHVDQLPAPHGLSPAGRIDPALIDRVAEDVIGRVERRIRIERERRGG